MIAVIIVNYLEGLYNSLQLYLPCGFFCFFFYIALILIWFKLAAIVNPDKYLYLGTMALTFITTIQSIFSSMIKIANTGEEILVEILNEDS